MWPLSRGFATIGINVGLTWQHLTLTAGSEGPGTLGDSHLQLVVFGGVAEWLGKGLQNPLHRFNSGPRLGTAVACRTSGA
jgi:hypothetical protein